MQSIFAFLVSLTLVFGLGYSGCPTGTFQGLQSEVTGGYRCYWYFDRPQLWVEAARFCGTLGWNFTSVHYALENKYIQTNLQNLSFVSGLVWLGGSVDYCLNVSKNDSCNQWLYVWQDGSPFDYRNFALGNGGASRAAQGIAMNIETGQWFDIDDGEFEGDSIVLPYLCSRDFPSDYVPPKCPEGAFQGLIPKDCYLMVEKQLAWRDAELDCISKGGHLTSIHNPNNNNLIRKKLSQMSTQNLFWIGAESVYHSHGFYSGYEYDWTDQTTFDSNICPSFNSACNPSGANQSLVINATDGGWYTQIWGSVKLPYVCKLPAIKQYK